MIYRTMKQTPGPKFTYVERLFLSGKWYNRLYGHTIVLGKMIGRLLAISGIVLGCGVIILALFWGVGQGMEYLSNILHINFLLIFLILLIVALIIGKLIEFMKDNRKKIELNIQNKVYAAKQSPKE
jgi:hypothetical protein